MVLQKEWAWVVGRKRSRDREKQLRRLEVLLNALQVGQGGQREQSTLFFVHKEGRVSKVRKATCRCISLVTEMSLASNWGEMGKQYGFQHRFNYPTGSTGSHGLRIEWRSI